MKKIIFAFAFIVISSVIGYGYAMKCPLCIEDIQNSKQNIGDFGIAHRCYDKPYKEIDGKIYGVYRCNYGHEFLVELGN